MKIYCFGNRLLKQDSLPIVLLPKLQEEFPKHEFIEANSPDDIEEESEINILDTVKGIDKVCLISDINGLCHGKNCSLHDFDLGMTLKLMQKMGKLKKIRIIGIPMNYLKHKAFIEIKQLIKKL